MISRILIVIALVAVLAAGCGASPENVDSAGIANGETPGNVYDFEVNGTRCIFVKVGYGSGLQCDFNGDSK